MDISQYNTRVIQEPRGMIRVITLIFAILAFATTSGFDTTISFKMTCPADDTPTQAPLSKELAKIRLVANIKLPVEYPFKFEGQTFTTNKSCAEDSDKQIVNLSKMDFSSSAQFYVATGVLSFLYSTACLVVYIFGARHYETNPLVPVIDLAVTAILMIFWLAGASAWAAGVSDVKYYTKTDTLFKKFDFCTTPVSENSVKEYCYETNPGKFTSLHISLIFGFANILLWAASSWFVFKETQFHRKPIPEMGPPGQQGFDQFGGQMAGQQQTGQTHFPQQRQFADGY